MRNFRLTTLVATFLTLLFALPTWGKLTVSVTPNPLTTIDTGVLSIVSDQEIPSVPKLPDVPGLTWASGPQSSSSSNIEIINGNVQRRKTATTSFLFHAAKPGTFTIPAFTVVEDGVQTTAGPVTVTVEDAGTAPTNAETGEITAVITTVPGGLAGEDIYPGQTVPFELRVIIPQAQFQGIDYPAFELDNAAWLTPVQPDPRNPKMEPPAQSLDRRGTAPCVVTRFRGRVTPIHPGEFQIKANTDAVLNEPRQARRAPRDGAPDDPFFDDFFNRASGRQVRIPAALGPLTVIPLPPAPADSPYLGLVGRWQGEWSIDLHEVPAGEPVTLTLRLRGSDNADGVTAPKIAPLGFRAFEPEVTPTKSADGTTIEIKWALVPLRADAVLPALSACTFDPAAKKYVRLDFTPALKILPPLHPAAASPAENSAANSANASPKAGDEALAPLENRIVPILRLPLWRNLLPTAIPLTALAAIAGLGFWIAAVRRDNLAGNPAARRRRDATRAIETALRQLESANGDDHARILRETLLPALASRLELPPGTTAAALADRLRRAHPELADLIQETEENAFRPHGATRVTANGKRLRELLAKLTLLPLLIAFCFASASHAAESAKSAEPAPTLAQMQAQYDRGDFADALKTVDALITRLPANSASATLLYNRGNCLQQLRRTADALAAFERASRLAPGHAEIRQNRDLLRRSLKLDEVSPATTPRSLLLTARDRLRPDQWLRLALLATGAGFASAGILRWRQKSAWTALLLGLLLAVLATTAAVTQVQTRYRAGQWLVRQAAPTARLVPDEAGAPQDTKLRQGQIVLLLEQHDDWCRIQVDDRALWLRADSLTSVW